MLFDPETYMAGLTAIFVAGLVTGLLAWSPQLLRVTFVIVLNWAAGLAFGWLTGITDGWWFNIIIDSIAAAAILWRPAGVWQGAVGVCYAVQLVMHAGYGAHYVLPRLFPAEPDKYLYYDALTGVAWLQLLIVGGWCGGIWGGGLADRWRARRRALHPSAVSRSYEEP